ncbi:MAG: hypothetical protein ACTSWZ_07950, partial [Candidatus Heimdallarchaeaceae archaeon]
MRSIVIAASIEPGNTAFVMYLYESPHNHINDAKNNEKNHVVINVFTLSLYNMLNWVNKKIKINGNDPKVKI